MDTAEHVWSTIVRNPTWPLSKVAAECGVSEEYVAKLKSKSGSAEPERVRLLKKGIDLTNGDRNRTYGPPFDNLDACAKMWSSYMSAKYEIPETFRFTAEDVAHMMQLVKMTRTFHGPYHADNYLDNAVYGAIAGECRLEEERQYDRAAGTAAKAA